MAPGFDIGSTPTLTVRAWESAAGSFDAAVRGSWWHGEASFTTRPLGGPTTPVDMGNFGNPATGIGILVIPEPSMYALAITAVVVVAMMRRRN